MKNQNSLPSGKFGVPTLWVPANRAAETRHWQLRTSGMPGGVAALLMVLALLLFVYPLLAQTDAAAPSMPADTKGLAYAADWGQEQQPALARFHAWAERYQRAAASGTQGQLFSDGLALAKQRRAAFAEVIQTDLAQAIASAVPASVRQQLPAEIVAELETRISGVGDYAVLGAVSARGGPAVEPIQRTVRLGGQTYPAFVYLISKMLQPNAASAPGAARWRRPQPGDGKGGWRDQSAG